MPTYYESYQYFYDKTKRYSEAFLKRGLILGMEENRSYNFSYNSAVKKLSELHTPIDAFFKNNFPNTCSAFKQRAHFYTKDRVRSVLNNEAKAQFEEEHKTSKLKHYTYLKCICDLAQLTALDDASASFRNNTELYELIYVLNKWNYFTLKYYKADPEVKKCYYELYDKRHGKKETVVAPLGEYPNSVLQKSNSKTVSNIEVELSIFDREDKILLLYICFECVEKAESKIPLTEFTKIITITKDIYDPAIFTTAPSRVSLYKQLSEGLTNYKDRIAQMKKLNELIEKVTRFKMSATKNLLISQRNTLSKRNNPKYS